MSTPTSRIHIATPQRYCFPPPDSWTDKAAWLHWIKSASTIIPEDYRHRLRTGPNQIRALLLAHHASTDDDIRLGLHAISRLKTPWALSVPWSPRVTRTLLPSLIGRRALQLFLHLFRAVLIGHASPACLPTNQHIRLASLPLIMNQDPAWPVFATQLAAAKRALRHHATVLRVSRHHPLHITFTPVDSHGYGRNGPFRIEAIALNRPHPPTARRTHTPSNARTITIAAVSKKSTYNPPLTMTLREPDAHALLHALTRALHSPSHGRRAIPS